MISDLPDAGITASTKLYSQEFYGLVRRVLAPDGRLAVHAGPVETRPRVFWTIDTTIQAAGLRTAPYRVGGHDSGFAAGPDRTAGASRAPHDWGFLLASRTAPALSLDPDGPSPRTLTPAALTADARAASRTRIPGLPPSTLVHPRYAD